MLLEKLELKEDETFLSYIERLKEYYELENNEMKKAFKSRKISNIMNSSSHKNLETLRDVFSIDVTDNIFVNLVCGIDTVEHSTKTYKYLMNDKKNHRYMYSGFYSDIIRICPKCMEESPYIRGNWHELTTIHCQRHRIQLLDCCPTCNRDFENDIITNLECKCGSKVNEYPLQKSTYSRLQNEIYWLCNLINESNNKYSFLWNDNRRIFIDLFKTYILAKTDNQIRYKIKYSNLSKLDKMIRNLLMLLEKRIIQSRVSKLDTRILIVPTEKDLLIPYELTYMFSYYKPGINIDQYKWYLEKLLTILNKKGSIRMKEVANVIASNLNNYDKAWNLFCKTYHDNKGRFPQSNKNKTHTDSFSGYTLSFPSNRFDYFGDRNYIKMNDLMILLIYTGLSVATGFEEYDRYIESKYVEIYEAIEIIHVKYHNLNSNLLQEIILTNSNLVKISYNNDITVLFDRLIVSLYLNQGQQTTNSEEIIFEIN